MFKILIVIKSTSINYSIAMTSQVVEFNSRVRADEAFDTIKSLYKENYYMLAIKLYAEEMK